MTNRERDFLVRDRGHYVTRYSMTCDYCELSFSIFIHFLPLPSFLGPQQGVLPILFMAVTAIAMGMTKHKHGVGDWEAWGTNTVMFVEGDKVFFH